MMSSSKSSMKRRQHHHDDDNDTSSSFITSGGARSSILPTTKASSAKASTIKTSFEVEGKQHRRHHHDGGGQYHGIGDHNAFQKRTSVVPGGGAAGGSHFKTSIYAIIFLVSILAFGSYVLNPKIVGNEDDMSLEDINTSIGAGGGVNGGGVNGIDVGDVVGANDEHTTTSSPTVAPAAEVVASVTFAPTMTTSTAMIDVTTTTTPPTAAPDSNAAVDVVVDNNDNNTTTNTSPVKSSNQTNTNDGVDGNGPSTTTPSTNDTTTADGKTGSSSTGTPSSSSGSTLNPPNPIRDESRIVYFGVPPPKIHWPEDIPRQSSNSPNKLLNPPKFIKDPYGWMRDESRQNSTILQHIESENNYTKQMTNHLQSLQDTIYEEFHSMLQETDHTLPLLKLGRNQQQQEVQSSDSIGSGGSRNGGRGSSRMLKRNTNITDATDATTNKIKNKNKNKNKNKKSTNSTNTNDNDGGDDDTDTELTSSSASEPTTTTTTTAAAPSYWYYSRTFEGESYSVHCRAPYNDNGDDSSSSGEGNLNNKANQKHQQQQGPNTPWKEWDGLSTTSIIDDEVVYLDENVVCENQSYCDIGVIAISPSQKYIAYTVDYSGSETYQLFIKYIEGISSDDNNDDDSKRIVYNSTLEFYRNYNNNDGNGRMLNDASHKDGTGGGSSSGKTDKAHQNYTPFSKPSSSSTSSATPSPNTNDEEESQEPSKPESHSSSSSSTPPSTNDEEESQEPTKPAPPSTNSTMPSAKTNNEEDSQDPSKLKSPPPSSSLPPPPPLSKNVVWGDDDNTIFYLILDEESRPYQLFQKQVTKYLTNDGNDDGNNDNGDKDNDSDILLYEEDDDMFWLGMEKSLDGKYLLVETSSSESSEMYYMPLKSTPNSVGDTGNPLKCIAKRRPKVLYGVEHRNDEWWIISNVNGTPNFQLFTSPVTCDNNGDTSPAADTGDVTDSTNAAAGGAGTVTDRANATGTNGIVAPDDGNGRQRLLRAGKQNIKGKQEHAAKDDDSSACPWTLVMDPSSVSDTNEEPEPLFDGSDVIGRRVVDDVTAYDSLVVFQGREDGIPRIWILWLCPNPDGDEECRKKDSGNDGGKTSNGWLWKRLEFPEAAHDVSLAPQNQDFQLAEHGGMLILDYSSLVTPYQFLGIPLGNATHSANDFDARIVLKEKAVPGYSKDLYDSDRLTVTSRDGHTEIPVSLVYHKDTMAKLLAPKGSNFSQVPVHMYAYGAYGASMEDYFASTRCALLDRGILYVIVHVRGGGEMGRNWYEEPNGAKYLCKKNTFNDFIDVARWLVTEKHWTTTDMMSCEGRSAGGLTIGASLNQAPELFSFAIMGVPFVDLMNTMVDASIPLTAGEWEEWGNPSEEKYFDYMRSYSPMNNVPSNVTYPSLLVLGGLYDPRVQYWEPTKFAATVRYQQRDRPNPNPVLLQIDSSSGHFSASDRYKHLKQRAFEYAVLLDQLGLTGTSD